MYTPVNPVLLHKSGFKGVKIIQVFFCDAQVKEIIICKIGKVILKDKSYVTEEAISIL